MELSSIVKYTTKLIHEKSLKGKLSRFILFLALYLIGRYLLMIFESTEIAKTLLSPLFDYIAYLITKLCCFVMQLFYPDIYSSNNYTIYISGNPIIQLFPFCTGLNPMIRLSFTLFLYPISWRVKFFLFPISILTIFVAASLHFGLLIPIELYYPKWYDFAHDWVTKGIFYSFYFTCWLLWEFALQKFNKS
jgi:exosortase/archaeosortase family protein